MQTAQHGFSGMSWLNEPPRWRVEGATLRVETADETDFWRETFYGFVHDNGHFFYLDVAGDFSAEVTIAGDYSALYDQSGLMLRAGESHWIKTGIEFTDGLAHLSAVVTNGHSDWSVMPPPAFSGSLRIRLTRHGEAIRVQFLHEGEWRLLRLGFLDMPEVCSVGVMCCSPTRAGFAATFDDFVVGDPVSRELHE